MNATTRKQFADAKEFARVTRSLEGFKQITISADEAFALADEEPDNVHYLLSIKKLPFEVLHKFAENYDDTIKKRIAIKYPLLPETYQYLARQSDDVKVRLLGNKKLPDYILAALKMDTSEYVREQAARWEMWQKQKL